MNKEIGWVLPVVTSTKGHLHFGFHSQSLSFLLMLKAAWLSQKKLNRKPFQRAQPPPPGSEVVRTPVTAGSAPKKHYLCSYEDVRHIGHADFQLGDPLLLDVVVRGRVHHWEADQEHVRVGVGQGPQLVVVLLPGENGKCVMGWGITVDGGSPGLQPWLQIPCCALHTSRDSTFLTGFS